MWKTSDLIYENENSITHFFFIYNSKSFHDYDMHIHSEVKYCTILHVPSRTEKAKNKNLCIDSADLIILHWSRKQDILASNAIFVSFDWFPIILCYKVRQAQTSDKFWT